MITKDVFDIIVSDIKKDDSFLDVEKADFMTFMTELYPCYSSEKLEKEIQNLN